MLRSRGAKTKKWICPSTRLPLRPKSFPIDGKDTRIRDRKGKPGRKLPRLRTWSIDYQRRPSWGLALLGVIRPRNSDADHEFYKGKRMLVVGRKGEMGGKHTWRCQPNTTYGDRGTSQAVKWISPRRGLPSVLISAGGEKEKKKREKYHAEGTRSGPLKPLETEGKKEEDQEGGITSVWDIDRVRLSKKREE